ncbi:MAG: outer membrane beta-barrel protein [Bryobacterales bacterium]|nr:outer membrane beta-barrel protein [Bryobacterales bacterium]
MSRVIYLLVLGMLAAAALARAQTGEIGVAGGYGTIAAEDISYQSFGFAGVEVCGRCDKGFAVFGEYSHWFAGPSRGITSFDLVAGGLRIQGRRRIRPFFDAGLAVGRDAFTYSGGRDAHTNWGAVLAGGVAIPIGERFYVRPQFRVYALTGLHFAIGGGAVFGIRF